MCVVTFFSIEILTASVSDFSLGEKSTDQVALQEVLFFMEKLSGLEDNPLFVRTKHMHLYLSKTETSAVDDTADLEGFCF